MVQVPTKKLNNGAEIPVLGFGIGTVWYKPDRFSAFNPDVVSIVKEAIKAGYRHIDTAEGYGTEAELREAIRESGVPRQDLFITTKVIHSLAEGKIEDLTAAFDKTLERLGTDYVDLYILHSPYIKDNKYVESDVAAAWKILESIQRAGKAKSIAVSNFRRHHIENLLKTAEIRPVANQIQFNPYLQGAPSYAAWLQESQGIAVQTYMGLAPLTWLKGNHLDAKLAELAAKYGVSEATVLIRWQLDLGAIVLNTTKKPERMHEFFSALDLQLSAEDREEITRIGQSHHIRIPVGALYDGDEVGPYE
ncbi:Aldo/keto reductase [Cryphonectria parasitica EP155]|uniref:Aldo/keto reductase n=1 Tax=Cryphonectria parasitica (strain ATCC 38755 / EP155) TaxID=660469 RepID=A0A9P4Y0G7_CRYP1|nr:Aldo/keto reductase [Cryphonectria parasitica EP155]KAF3764296.1 Aldo/keto reductase [Cryphonectria parasitica EP155]